MFLLQRIDFIALIGLFVQAFLAWVFVAILATMRRGERASRAFGHFYFAFVVLALALTVVSVRFFQAHEVAKPFWYDGNWAPTVCYIVYQGLKGLFGLFLVRGSYALVDRTPPAWFTPLGWSVVATLAVSPLLLGDMTSLLIVQAPVMILCSVAALRVLRSALALGSGPRIVRWSLIGFACAWLIDATAAGLHDRYSFFRYVLAANSFLDLGAQLSLGTGLVITLLQETHRRLGAAEVERERLQSVIDRDERLRALGTLLSGVAHELNNPLTVILGYSDLMAAKESDNNAARIVAEQAHRCRGIVRNLSALAGQSQHPLQELDASELVERVVRGIQLENEENSPQIQIVASKALSLNADRIGLEQVLTNLVSNALQASPAGGVVTIEAAPAGTGVSFRVTDEGPGVPHELRNRLFEPFFTTKGPGKGTGLGLSIAHAIVKAHGGTISVEGGPHGRGARFCVFIPNTSQVRASAPKPAQQVTGSRRLLIIDDEPAIRSVVRHQAELRGWSVSEADSAEGAMRGVDRLKDFDALLCDLRMPGIGGVGLYDLLRSEHPKVLERTVFVTGDLASPESVHFSTRCARPLVQKPFEFDELFAIIGREAVAANP